MVLGGLRLRAVGAVAFADDSLQRNSPIDCAGRRVAMYPCVHGTFPFISMAWRRSGNLAVTAGTHALIDAVRNALLS